MIGLGTIINTVAIILGGVAGGLFGKRLTECYKIIANCVNLQCSFFNESPSPYITTLDKPLTIDPKSIEISEKFKAQSSIKKLFIEKITVLGAKKVKKCVCH